MSSFLCILESINSEKLEKTHLWRQGKVNTVIMFITGMEAKKQQFVLKTLYT